MDLRQLTALALKASAILGGFVPLAVVLFMRRYDVFTMVTRLRRLRLHDPDVLWVLLVFGLVIGHAVSLRSAWKGARRVVTGRDAGALWTVLQSLLIALALLFGLNAVLDAYGWRVQL